MHDEIVDLSLMDSPDPGGHEARVSYSPTMHAAHACTQMQGTYS
jgi:hypothetical protein